jgi:hypothetical protein
LCCVTEALFSLLDGENHRSKVHVGLFDVLLLLLVLEAEAACLLFTALNGVATLKIYFKQIKNKSNHFVLISEPRPGE